MSCFFLTFKLINVIKANGEENLSFSNLLNQFNKKALEKGFDMGAKLSFIIKISNTIGKLKKKLEMPPKEFISAKKFEKVLAAIPEFTTIITKDYNVVFAREFLGHAVNFINESQTVRIGKVKEEICSEIAFIPPNKYDQFFDDWYKMWDKEQINPEHVNQVYKELPKMTTKYEELYELYHKRLGEVEGAETDIKFLTRLIHADFDKLSKLNPKNEADIVQVKEIVDRLQPLMDKLFNHLGQMQRALTNVKEVLENYNKDRVKWIEFLMEMRESLESERRNLVNPSVDCIASTSGTKNDGPDNIQLAVVVKKKRKVKMEKIITYFANLLCFRKEHK